MPSANPTPHPLDAAARDELARRAEEALEATQAWENGPADGFGAIDRLNDMEDARGKFEQAATPDVILALLASVRGAEAERDAWREYAVHLEWCRSCAEDGMDSCHEGKALRDAARAHPPTQEPADA